MSIEIRKEINMATTNPFQFIQQVRSEVSKITWPTRREVLSDHHYGFCDVSDSGPDICFS